MYVPKYVKEAQKQRKDFKNNQYDQHAVFWKPPPQQFINLYQEILSKFDGDKDKAMQHIEKLKRQGALDQIFANQKYNLKEMITDKQ